VRTSLERARAEPGASEAPRLSEATLQQLRALGYIE
jgi:hypothetical protein